MYSVIKRAQIFLRIQWIQFDNDDNQIIFSLQGECLQEIDIH